MKMRENLKKDYDSYVIVNFFEIILIMVILLSLYIFFKNTHLSFSIGDPSTSTPLGEMAGNVFLVSLGVLVLLELYSFTLAPKKCLYFNRFCLVVKALLIYFILISRNFRYPILLIYVPFLLLFKYCFRIYLVNKK